MSNSENRKVAIIPARGKSKRIPRKNIKPFMGKPIIAYAIETALQSGLFDMVMVSTDDKEIAEVAKKYGAKVPFFRSASTSDDYSTTADVLVEVINELKNIDKVFEYACCIYPTASLLTIENVKDAFQKLTENNYATVFPVCPYSSSVFRGLQMKADGKVEMIWPENLNKRSQDLMPVYHDAGQFYWLNIESFLKEKSLYNKNTGAIILEEMQVQDIDNEGDWLLAEMKFKLLHEKA